MVEGMVGAGYVMPRQVYRCPEHGEFERTVPFGKDVPGTAPCPEIVVCNQNYEHPCPRVCRWVPPTVNFIGGPTTGAKPSLP